MKQKRKRQKRNEIRHRQRAITSYKWALEANLAELGISMDWDDDRPRRWFPPGREDRRRWLYETLSGPPPLIWENPQDQDDWLVEMWDTFLNDTEVGHTEEEREDVLAWCLKYMTPETREMVLEQP